MNVLRYRLLRCLYIFIIFTVLLGSWNLEVSAQNVIADENLAEAVLKKLVFSGILTNTDTIADITEAHLGDPRFTSLLDAQSKGIVVLTGLEHATNLRNLSLRGNKIEDISPLSGLTMLKTLTLSENNISNIDALSEMTELTHLALQENKIEDISPLEKLTMLETLILRENNISNIDALSEMTELTTLYLSTNKIEDISPLEDLTMLTRLYLDGNNISDISPLEDLTMLTRLYLDGNNISDISPLSGLTMLTRLYLQENQISDISPLEDLTMLTRLYLQENQISDISPLSGLTMLERLYLHRNQISDISPLEDLTMLTRLALHANKISDLSVLEGLPALSTLYIDREFWEDPANTNMVDALSHVQTFLFDPLPDPPLETETETEPEVTRRRRIITRCGLGWSPQSQYKAWGELPKVMIYALEFEYDPERHGRYTCKTIEIRTGDDSIENLAGWSLYLGTLYNPSSVPLTIPEEHSQMTDNILRLTPEMLGLETFPCNTVNGISHPLPGVQYVLKTDENVLVDTAYSCFLWGQNAWTTVDGVNVKSQRSVSSAALREMETPRLERYIWDNTGVYITYMDLEAFTWDRVVLSDWLLPPSEVSAPGAPSALQRNLVTTTWGALKKQ